MGYTFTGSRYGWSYQLIFVGFCGQSYKQGFIRLATDCSTIHLRLSSNEGLNPTLGLVASCYVERLFLCCRPVCWWLGWGSMSIGHSIKSHFGRSAGIVGMEIFGMKRWTIFKHIWLFQGTECIILLLGAPLPIKEFHDSTLGSLYYAQFCLCLLLTNAINLHQSTYRPFRLVVYIQFLRSLVSLDVYYFLLAWNATD